jgi:hypothetical protein
MAQAFDEGLKKGHEHAESYWRFKIAEEQTIERELDGKP